VPDAPTVSLAALPATRRALLTAVKRRGEARATELAGDLGITVSAIRQHLAGLGADALVDHRDERSGPGRPKRLYRLTERGDELFPRTYGELTTELLAYAEEEDPELVERLFERRRQRRVERAKARLAGRPFGDQIEELTRILDEDGYLADSEALPDGTYRIVEHNCAILAVAMRYGHACGTELSFIREVLPDATVERVAHQLAGARTCAYEITPRQPSRTTSAGSLS
jgi:DeoR family suf operon transcriptional repressor